MTRSIATLTASPALDESTSVPYVLADRKLRCTDPVREPGGGGINVARAIHKLGGEALACFPAGGPTGDMLIALLDAEGVQRRVVPVQGWTRQNLNVTESVSGRQFRFCMPGAAVTEREWTSLLDALRGLEPAPELVVLSGSLPPGVPPDFYARAIEAMRARGSQVVVDASGEALVRCAGRGALVIKTSLHEFETLTNVRDADEAHLGELASQTVARGMCDILVISLGPGGALLATRDGRERIAAPAVPAKSTVGAGDSMVAGIVLALARGHALRDAVSYGVAAGSAAVMQPGTALCNRDDVDRLYARMTRAAAA